MHDPDFKWYLTNILGITCDNQSNEDSDNAYQTAIAIQLQHKPLYELVILAYSHTKFLRNSPHFSPLIINIYTIFDTLINQARITADDIKRFSALEDPQCIEYALQTIKKLHETNPSTQSSKLILTLHLKLKQLTSTSDKQQVIPVNKKAPITSCKGRASDEWILLEESNQKATDKPTDILYKEIEHEMVDTVVLTEEFLNKNRLQREILEQQKTLEQSQQHLEQEFTVTYSAELDVTKILQDYQCRGPEAVTQSITHALDMLTWQRQQCEEQLAAKMHQKQVLDQTSEQLRTDIGTISQVMLEKIDNVTQRIQVIEREKARLTFEKQELMIEHMRIKKRLDTVNARLENLSTLEQELKAKQSTHAKAKRALAATHFTEAVRDGKLLPK